VIIRQPESWLFDYITSTTKTSAMHNMMLSFKNSSGGCGNSGLPALRPDYRMFFKIHVDFKNV
jgi:hypothetical protein